MSEKLLVFGHRNPDTDAIGSAIAFSHWLNETGKEAEPVALGNPNDETAYALDHFGLEPPRVITSAQEEVSQVALVDHNEPQQSVGDIDHVEVVYVVDHHRIANFNTSNPLFYRAEPIGSTCSIIYKLYKEYEVEIPKNIAGIMLSAIISDTLLFKSPTSTEQDEAIGQALAQIADVDLEAYGQEMLKAGTNIDAMTDEEILNGDSKQFSLNDFTVKIGQVNVVGFDDILARKDSLVALMEKELVDEQLDSFVMVATDILNNDSIGFVVGNHTDLIGQAFGGTVEDNQLALPGVVSRKKQVVPPLTEAYETIN